MALTELARFLPRGAQHNRYLRSGMRPHHREDMPDRFRRSDPVPLEEDHGPAPTLEPAVAAPAAAPAPVTPTVGNDSIG
jgi:hypothetical protein